VPIFSENFSPLTKTSNELASYIAIWMCPRYLILAVMILIYAAMGCVMDSMPMMMLTVPIFLPIVNTLGFDAIWFGIIIILVMELAMVTPAGRP
jgi:TRAP-type C4-dicarboxylate transport system permease large subunit